MVQNYKAYLLALVMYTRLLAKVSGIAGSSTDKVYMVTKAGRSWNEARDVCSRNGGHLVSILNSTDWNLWEYLMSPDLDSHQRPSNIYWIGLHAPNSSNPESLLWDICQPTPYTEPLVEDTGPACQCVHAWFNREVFNQVFLNMWLRSEPCNQTHAFICEMKQDPVCLSQCDEVVAPATSEPACLDACNGSLSCTATFNVMLGLCHMKVNRNQSDDYLAICRLSSLVLNQTCTQVHSFNTLPEIVDKNMNVSDTYCIDPNSSPQDSVPVTHPASNNNNNNSSTDEPVCMCSCEMLDTFLAEPQPEKANLSVEEKIHIIVKELSIDKKNTTSAQRGLVSVMDYRASSVGIGAVGVGIIVGVFAIIVIIDLSRLWEDIVKAMKKIMTFLKNNKVNAT